MVRRWVVLGAAAAVLVGLSTPVVSAQEQPSETQFDLATYFSSLGAAAHEGVISSAYKPVPTTETSSGESFRVSVTTVEMDGETEAALVAELFLACEQSASAPPSDFSFTTVVCPVPEAVEAIFSQAEPPVVVVAEREEGWDLGLTFQLTVVGVDSSRPVYVGTEGDPNADNNTGYDLFWPGDAPALGFTTYAKSGFDFVDFDRGLALIKNPGWIAYLFPGSLFGELGEPEVWINDGGWDHAPIPGDWGGLFLGSSEFVSEALTGEAPSEEEPEPEAEPDEESPPEEEPQPEPAPEEDPEPVAEEEPTEEPTSEPSGNGIPGALVAVGAAAAAAAVAGGVIAATRRRRQGKCDDLRDRSDNAQTAWEGAAGDMNAARNAYAASIGTESEAAALETQTRAEVEEAEAYAEFQRHWNTYQDCLSSIQDAVHAPPPGTETRTTQPEVEPAESSTPGVIAGSTAPSTAPTEEVDWRVDEDRYEIWRQPVGSIHIEMNRTSEAFESWLEGHGEPRPSDLGIGATIPLDDTGDLRVRNPLVALLAEGGKKHWVTMAITIPTHRIGRYCERKWVRRDGGPWTPTDDYRLGKLDEPIPDSPIYVRDDYETAESLADAMIWQLKKVSEMEDAAAQAQIDLRERCGQ